MPRIAVVAGTRPEAIKLASVVAALNRLNRFNVVVVDSAQHNGLASSTFAEFGIATQKLSAHALGKSLAQRSLMHMRAMSSALADFAPAAVVVQGDTLTTYSAAHAARRLGVVVAHVEAGLRADQPNRPWPEESIRRRIARIAGWHFPPTALAATHLVSEGIDRSAMAMVGNTGIDALRCTLASMSNTPLMMSREILVTLHRREACGLELDQTCAGLCALLDLHPSLRIYFPLHPDPSRTAALRRHLESHSRITLAPALGYREFITRMCSAALVVTDSGGIQEEAPYLGVPTLIVRRETERCEALTWAGIRRVDPVANQILSAGSALLGIARPQPWPFEVSSPFGDGHSGSRIADWLASKLLGTVQMRPADVCAERAIPLVRWA